MIVGEGAISCRNHCGARSINSVVPSYNANPSNISLILDVCHGFQAGELVQREKQLFANRIGLFVGKWAPLDFGVEFARPASFKASTRIARARIQWMVDGRA